MLERERQQRQQEDRLRKFRQEQEENDKCIRSPAAKTRKLCTPRALRAPNNTLTKNTAITSSVISLQSAPPQIGFGASNTNINFAASSSASIHGITVNAGSLHELTKSVEAFNNSGIVVLYICYIFIK